MIEVTKRVWLMIEVTKRVWLMIEVTKSVAYDRSYNLG